MPIPESAGDSGTARSTDRLLTIDTGNLFRDNVGAEGVAHSVAPISAPRPSVIPSNRWISRLSRRAKN